MDKQEWAIERVKYWWTELLYHYQDQIQTVWPFPAVRFNRATCRAGWANAYYNVVSLSTHFLYNEPGFDRTIGHECTHIFANKLHRTNVGHGEEWKRMMRQLGLSDSRCHSYESAKGRESTKLLLCPRCGQRTRIGKAIQNKILRGVEKRIFGCCRGDITAQMILTARPYNEV